MFEKLLHSILRHMSVSLTESHKNPLVLPQLFSTSSWKKYPGVLKFGFGRNVLPWDLKVDPYK